MDVESSEILRRCLPAGADRQSAPQYDVLPMLSFLSGALAERRISAIDCSAGVQPDSHPRIVKIHFDAFFFETATDAASAKKKMKNTLRSLRPLRLSNALNSPPCPLSFGEREGGQKTVPEGRAAHNPWALAMGIRKIPLNIPRPGGTFETARC